MGFLVGAVLGLVDVGIAALASGIAGLSLATLGTVLIGGALAFGAAALNKSLLKAKAVDAGSYGGGGGGYSPQPQPQDIQQTIKQAVPPRRRHYGRVKAGGYIDFFDSTGGRFYELIMCAQGQVSAFEEHWLNDQQALLGAAPSTDETPLGAKVGAVNGIGTSPTTTYGFTLATAQKVAYVGIYPTTLTESTQNAVNVTYPGGTRWGYAQVFQDTALGGGFHQQFVRAWTGSIRARIYGRPQSNPATLNLLGALTFTNSLVPQFIDSSDQATLFTEIRVVLDIPTYAASVESTVGLTNQVGIDSMLVSYIGSGEGDAVVSTLAGGGLGEDPFTTTSGSGVVTIYHAAHGLETGAILSFTGIVGDVNGIPAAEFEEDKSITIVDPDTYTATYATHATASGAGGGDAVRWAQTQSGAQNRYLFEGAYLANIYVQLGADEQAAQKILIDAFPTKWGVDHRLAGIATALCTFQDVPQESFSTVYPQGIPAYRAVLAGALVFDPRDEAQSADDEATWAWSENAALVIFDFLTHADGMGRPRAMFDADSFAAAADVCDETVALKDGSSEPRYRIDASYDLTERPSDVLQRFLAACDGYLYPTPAGTWGLRVGKWYEPTVTVEDAHILEYSMEQGVNALARFNQLKLTYTEPLNDYQETEAQAWENSEAIAAFGTLVDQLQLLEVPSPSQARRLGKIASAKSNPEWRGTVKTTLAGLAAMGENIITVNLDELEIAQTFQVTGFQISGDLSYCLLDVSSLSSTAYDWDPATEEGERPATAAASVPLQVPDTPMGFAVLAGQILVQGSTNAAAAKASWDTPSRSTLAHEVQYKLTSDSEWTSAAIPAGTSAWTSGVLNDGSSYDFRLRAIGPGGAPSSWTATSTVVMTADATPPSAPTALSSSHAGAVATVQWTNPTSANFYATKIYRASSNSFAAASVVGVYYGGNGLTKTHQGTLSAGTYYWWAVAVNASGVASSATGPTTQTIT